MVADIAAGDGVDARVTRVVGQRRVDERRAYGHSLARMKNGWMTFPMPRRKPPLETAFTITHNRVGCQTLADLGQGNRVLFSCSGWNANSSSKGG